MRFKTRILCSCMGLCVVLACVHLSIFSWYGIKKERDYCSRAFEAETEDVVTGIDLFLSERLADVAVMASDPAIADPQATWAGMTARLNQYGTNYRTYVQITVYNQDGVVIADTSLAHLEALVPDSPLFTAALQGKTSLMGFSYSLKRGSMHLVFWQPVFNADGMPFRILCARVPIDRIHDIVRLFHPPMAAAGISLELISSRGLLLYSNTRGDQVNSRVSNWEKIAPWFQRLKKSGNPLMIVENSECISAYGMCGGWYEVPEEAWFLRVSVPAAELFHEARRLTRMLFWFSLGIIGTSFLLVLRFSTTLSRPLEELGARADRLGAGDYRAFDEVAPRSDEFGRLIESFRTMAGKLGRSMAEVRDKTAALEKELTERRRVEASLRESEERFRLLVECAPIGIVSMDPAGHIEYVNQRFTSLFGYDLQDCPHCDRWMAAAPSGTGGQEALPSSESEQCRPADADACGGVDFDADRTISLTCKDGSHRMVIMNSIVLKTGNRICTLMDVTVQKEAEARMAASLLEKEVLLREIHHRVKNNLQVVSSLLNLQARKLKDRTHLAAFKEVADRVRSMALVHENLYRSPNLAAVDVRAYVTSLLAYLSRSYGNRPRGVAVTTDIEALHFGPDTAIPVGFILTELFSNCLKHAFPGNLGGEIFVALRRSEPGYELVVRDTGKGFQPKDEEPASASVGLDLVRTFVAQLEGTMEIDSSPGTTVRITFAEIHRSQRK